MSDIDPFDHLQHTVPFGPKSSESVEQSETKSALFEEIAMIEVTSKSSSQAKRHSTPHMRWRRPAAMASAAVFAAIAVLAGVLFLPGDGQSAAAAVIEAGEAVADLDSGQVSVSIDVREDRYGDEVTRGFIEYDFRFQGDDVIADLSYDLGPGNITFDSRVIRKAGFDYFETSDSNWLKIDAGQDSPPGGFDLIALLGRPDRSETAAMVDLVSAAADYTEVSSNDGRTTYQGSIAPAAFEAIDQQDLPTGFALVTQNGQQGVPESLTLTVLVEENQIASVVLDALGEYERPGEPNGYIDATITTTYEGLGEPVTIKAPSEDLIITSEEQAELIGADDID